MLAIVARILGLTGCQPVSQLLQPCPLSPILSGSIIFHPRTCQAKRAESSAGWNWNFEIIT